MKTKTWHYQHVAMSDFESENAMMTPFLESLDKLDEVIDQLELDGLCSEDVEFARESFKDLCLTLTKLISGKLELQKWLWLSEKGPE
jgi:hypothetical protein